jgi:hypothetical protein
MKLSSLALLAVKGCRGIVPKLSKAIGVIDQTTYRYIRENAPELTLAAALKVIREETGLTDEQILEEAITA